MGSVNKILIIVHVEPMFSSLLFDLEQLADQIANYATDFDRVINVSCEELLGSNRTYKSLEKFEQKDWLWGFYPDEYKDDPYWKEGQTYVLTNLDRYSEICPWMRELPKDAEYV